MKICSSKLISGLINLSFSSVAFSEILKQDKVIPIFKKGDQKNCNNYRPISRLSNISKIIEKLIHKQLYGFLGINNCLYTHQYGFRNQHLTIHALITIIEKIKHALDYGKITCGVLQDLQKVFDTVDHQILISKLKHYGIRGFPLNWFKSFLTKRRQFVEISNAQSETLFNERGVPLGSVPGPLLFLIYINDLQNTTNCSDIYHFADGKNLLYSSKSLKNINKKINFDLKKIIEWIRANKILLNIGQTKIMLFRTKKIEIKKYMNFKISGQKINILKEAKYLGLKLDQHLTFRQHMDTIQLKLNRANGLLAKIRYHVDSKLLKTIYSAIFEFHL